MASRSASLPDPPRLVDAASAAIYLNETGRLAPEENVRVRELPGGVSNIVLLVERDSDGTVPQPNFVVKQARAQLRVTEPWFCSVERIWREIEVLNICQRVLTVADEPAADAVPATTPQLLFSDRENYLFAMSAAPPHQVWKQHLLAGEVEPQIARACGTLLGQLHAGTWQADDVARRVGDRTFFDDLRISPYYRQVAAIHPGLQPHLDRLIDSIDDHCLALVHGDFSPKNLLVSESQLMLVDFEVGHFGDPAFDLGFFLSHLILKSFWASTRQPGASRRYRDLTIEFWAAYHRRMAGRIGAKQYEALQQRAILHFAACALARVDGKSPVEYLAAETQDVVREVATALLTAETKTWSQVLAQL